MNTYIVTLYDINNPGSSLQAYALQKYINQNVEGVHSDIIDYQPIYAKIGKNKLRGLLRRILFYRNERKSDRKYKEFNEKYIGKTNVVHNINEIKELPSVEVYIVGSDQLWNPDYDCGEDEVFWLSGICGKKISYATSVGKILSEEESRRIANRIKDFANISVREESTTYGLSTSLSKEVAWVCDPVFLLDADVYKSMCYDVKISSKYAVIYMTEKGELLDQIVSFMKAKGLIIVQMDGNRKRCDCDIHIKSIDPVDFLSWINSAEIVISSSFHATCFSIIFQKKFAVVMPQNNSERIKSILQLTNTDKRVIRNTDDIEKVLCESNYINSSNALGNHITDSKKYLTKALGENI